MSSGFRERAGMFRASMISPFDDDQPTISLFISSICYLTIESRSSPSLTIDGAQATGDPETANVCAPVQPLMVAVAQ
jgi:hypothetical protein